MYKNKNVKRMKLIQIEEKEEVILKIILMIMKRQIYYIQIIAFMMYVQKNKIIKEDPLEV